MWCVVARGCVGVVSVLRGRVKGWVERVYYESRWCVARELPWSTVPPVPWLW